MNYNYIAIDTIAACKNTTEYSNLDIQKMQISALNVLQKLSFIQNTIVSTNNLINKKKFLPI